MADYFTHFSCLLDVGTPENAARALDLYNKLSEEGASEEPPFGASDAAGAWDWKTAYDACEAATVLFLRKYGKALFRKAASPDARLSALTRIAALLPTHTRRSEEAQTYQQFSTPIPLGLAAMTAAAITPADRVLEPSAGTGLLAILAEIAGGSLILNELAEMRAGLLSSLFPAVSATRLEPDLDDLLWGIGNLFHRAAGRVERELDDNEQAQRRLQREQDGSEVKSVELERLTAEGQTLIERRNSMELFRDLSAEAFERHTGTPWRPRTGSMVNHRALTSAMIDSRDFLAAKRRAEAEVLLPAGPKVALTGGADFNDHRLIWAKLDQVRAKHPDMVLLHGSTPKGAELIASRWADHRNVPQVAFRPDWTKHGKAAPFKRNDALLEVLPVGVLVFPGTGIQENLADKARKLGIPVMKFDGGA